MVTGDQKIVVVVGELTRLVWQVHILFPSQTPLLRF